MPPGPTILLESCPISWPKRQVFKDGPMAHASILPGTKSYRLTLTLPDVHALVGTGELPCNSTYSKYFTGVIHQYSSYFPSTSIVLHILYLRLHPISHVAAFQHVSGHHQRRRENQPGAGPRRRGG
jgi:hypothetical protein